MCENCDGWLQPLSCSAMCLKCLNCHHIIYITLNYMKGQITIEPMWRKLHAYNITPACTCVYQYLWQAFPQLIRDHCSTKKYISGPSPCRMCIAQLAHLASGDLCLSDWHLLPGQDPTWHEQTPFGTFATGLTYTTIELHATGPISIQTRHQPYLINRYLQAELCGCEVFD